MKKKGTKFDVSLHVSFHLSSDETFMTNPPAVLNTDIMEVYDWSEMDDILSNTYGNLVSVFENFEYRGSGWVLDRLLKLALHILEFNPLRTTPYISLPKEV